MEPKSKKKLLIENILVFGVGGVIGRIVPLIMVPIITRLLPNTSYYGINDLVDTVVQLGCALAVLGMYDALYRIFFDSKDKEHKIRSCSTALIFNIFTSIVIFIILIVFRDYIAKIVFDGGEFGYLITIAAFSTLIGSTNNIVSAPTRMQNKRVQYLLIHFGSAVVSYAIAIPMILKGYYYIALPLASLFSALIVEILFFILNRNWFSLKKFDFKLLRQLLILALPLFPNMIVYWLFNFSDKIMISNLMGPAFVGIYGAGAKVAHISQIFFTAFSTGWQYVAYSTMYAKDQVKSNSKIFSVTATFSFILSIIATSLSYFVFNLLFVGDYTNGYIVMPYLFMSPLLQILYQICCSQLVIAKEAKPNFYITLSGALLNIVLNFILIPIIGIEGAAIATFVGYVAIVFLILAILLKKRLIILDRRLIINLLIFILYFVIWRFLLKDSAFSVLAASVAIVVLLIVNKNLFSSLPSIVNRLLKKNSAK